MFCKQFDMILQEIEKQGQFLWEIRIITGLILFFCLQNCYNRNNYNKFCNEIAIISPSR